MPYSNVCSDRNGKAETDHQSFVHETSGSGEGRENQDSRTVVVLASHELLGHQVHAVAQRRDQRNVGVAVECGEVVLESVRVLVRLEIM